MLAPPMMPPPPMVMPIITYKRMPVSATLAATATLDS